MLISEYWSSRFFKPSDIKKAGGHLLVTIKACESESFKTGDTKPVLAFKENLKKLPCNDTKRKKLVGLFGDDTDKWIGRTIMLTVGWTTYKGEQVETILVDRPKLPPQPKPVPFPTEADKTPEISDDDIPFPTDADKTPEISDDDISF